MIFTCIYQRTEMNGGAWGKMMYKSCAWKLIARDWPAWTVYRQRNHEFHVILVKILTPKRASNISCLVKACIFTHTFSTTKWGRDKGLPPRTVAGAARCTRRHVRFVLTTSWHESSLDGVRERWFSYSGVGDEMQIRLMSHPVNQKCGIWWCDEVARC